LIHTLCFLFPDQPTNAASLPVEDGAPQAPLLFVAKSPQLRAGAWCPGTPAESIEWEDLELGTNSATQSWQLFRKEDIAEWWTDQHRAALAMGQGGRGSAVDVLDDRQLNGLLDAPWQVSFDGKARMVHVKGFPSKLSEQTFEKSIQIGPTAKDLHKKRIGSSTGVVAVPDGFTAPLFLQRRWTDAATKANTAFEQSGGARVCYYQRQIVEFPAVRKQEQVQHCFSFDFVVLQSP